MTNKQPLSEQDKQAIEALLTEQQKRDKELLEIVNKMPRNAKKGDVFFHTETLPNGEQLELKFQHVGVRQTFVIQREAGDNTDELFTQLAGTVIFHKEGKPFTWDDIEEMGAAGISLVTKLSRLGLLFLINFDASEPNV